MFPNFLFLDSATLIFSSIFEMEIKKSKTDVHAHAHVGPGT